MAALQSIGFDLRSAVGRNWLTLLVAAPIQAGFVYTLLCGALSFHTDTASLNGLLLMFYLIHMIPGALEWLHIRGGGIGLIIVFLDGVPVSLLYARVFCILFPPEGWRRSSRANRRPASAGSACDAKGRQKNTARTLAVEGWAPKRLWGFAMDTAAWFYRLAWRRL